MPRFAKGYNALRWCVSCNVPLIERRCGTCDEEALFISITPPGDARPGFEYDREFIAKIVDDQYGEGTGNALLPSGHVFLLNRAPDEDRMDEIIIDGVVVGSLRYEIRKGWRVLLRPVGAARVAPVASKGVVVADVGAVGPVLEGKNLLSPGVISSKSDVEVGDEIIVLDPEGEPIATGTARQPTPQLIEGRGQGIKTRWKGRADPGVGKASSWADTVNANQTALQRIEARAVRFVSKVCGEHNNLPTAVSISGGKDSLATLLTVLEAGLKPSLIFADTGLEFKETLDNVNETAQKYGLKLLVESAGDAFWRGLDTFGPPAKDFRWCCKSCKLGPATRLINSNFPGGVLSFIGQRGRESEQRSKKGSVWRNPWVPNQIGASPIQDWSALQVWLYIFNKDAKYNPIYERGLHRIGCWLCPSSDKGDSDIAGDMHEDGERWASYLERYANERGLPQEWLDLGLWRWKRPPPWAKDALPETTTPLKRGASGLSLVLASGYQPCTSGVSVEGVFNQPLDLGSVIRMLPVLGDVILNDAEGWLETAGGKVQVFREGGLVVRAPTEEDAKALAEKTRQLVVKGTLCIGCGVCTGACPEHAIAVKDTVASIDPDKCIHCEKCLERCPIVDYNATEEWQG